MEIYHMPDGFTRKRGRDSAADKRRRKFTGASNSITLIEALDASRLNGSSTSRGASEEKQLLRKLLRAQVSDLSRIDSLAPLG